MLWKIHVQSVNDSFCIRDQEFELPKPMLDFLKNVERVHGSLHRPTDLLKHLIGQIGYKVRDYPQLGWHNSGITLPKIRAIGISTDMNNERKRFTLGHELGHAIIFEYGAGVTLSEDQTEDVCDEFSARLLVSDSILRSKLLEHGGNVESMASYFEVSVECMRLCVASRMRIHLTP